jgi:hypothetical protein
MFKDLITYKELYEASPECLAFGEVTFIRNFGPYRKGDKIDSIWFQLGTGIAEIYNENNEKINEITFQLVSV